MTTDTKVATGEEKQLTEALEHFFDAGGTRFDDITLYTSHAHFITEAYAMMAKNDPDLAGQHAVAMENITELLRELFHFYMWKKYGAS